MSPQKSAKRTTATGKKFKGFTDEERAAMKERVQELRGAKVDGDSAVLAKIAAMPEPDRTMAKRLHAISGTACLRMPRMKRSSVSSKAGKNSRRGTPRSASATRRTSTKVGDFAPCPMNPTRIVSPQPFGILVCAIEMMGRLVQLVLPVVPCACRLGKQRRDIRRAQRLERTGGMQGLLQHRQ